MSHEIETMAWTGQTPWHGLGFEVAADLTPEQMLRAARLDWTVSKRKVFYRGFVKDDLGAEVETDIQADDEFALVRDSDNAKLSMVGTSYKPIQNAEAMDFFTKFCAAGHMTMETAGSLWGGRYVWALARIGKDFVVGGSKSKDEIRPYLLLMSPHMFGRSMLIQYTPVRVVCWNTLCFALGGEKLRGNGSGFRMGHASKFDETAKARAEAALGLAVKETEEFKAAITMLSKKKATVEQTEEFFCEVLQWDPKDAQKKADAEAAAREPRLLTKFRAALEYAPGQALNTAKGTWWGNVNAVTAVIDHQVGRTRDTALKAAWVGTHGDLKRRAFDLALQKAA